MEVTLGMKAVHFIFAQETGGIDYYNSRGVHPNWPKGSSGITIGGGYDCGYNSPSEIAKDWAGLLSDSEIKILQSVSGLTGQKAANALTSSVINGVKVPYDVALKQFINTLLKKEVAITLSAFPQAEKLNPDTLGILTSIVYNRGSAMNDHDPKTQERKEMRMIRMLVPQKDYKNIAAQIVSMKRLWDGVPDYVGDHEQKMTGLLVRRDAEAKVVLASERGYTPDELLKISLN